MKFETKGEGHKEEVKTTMTPHDAFSQWAARRRPCARVSALCLLTFALCLLNAAQAFAQYGRPPESSLPQGGTPDVLKQVEIEQKLDSQLPLDALFRDEAGREVALSEYFKDGKPVVLALVYYECPMLCNQVLNGLTGSLLALKFTAGEEFRVVTVSFDERETPELAARKKETYLARYKRAGAERGWHFLTGRKQSIDRLAEATGFKYVWDARSNQFAHASAIMVATPEGRLSHYFYGIEYAPKDLRLSLVEASAGKIGSPVDKLILYCYHYDPTVGGYAPVVMNIVRLAGVATLVGLVVMLLLLRRYKRPASDSEDDEREGLGESVNAGGTA
ncbi:MAG TPA: SCO family protein [Pyrinomonadaceae bacterium]|nr:SCO family protein [Pyrinomonadaceae bacterium]